MDEIPKVDPAEAIRHFERKGFEFSFDWKDVWQGEHAKAFTVAKAMTRDVLETIRGAVGSALAEGKTFAEFADELRPELQKRGWWGKQTMTDPATGKTGIVQLGSPRRLRVIFNTNMRTAYAAGRWERIQRTKQAFPFLRYVSVMDGREREEHHAWHGTILPVDDPWWDTHYGPCDWGCRCTAQSLNLRMIERKGYKVSLEPQRLGETGYFNPRTGEMTKLENGIGPGWAYNVGKAYLDGVTPRPLASSVADKIKGKANPAKAPLTITAIERAAIVEYTMGGFRNLNGALREYRPEKVADQLRVFEGLFARVSLDQDMIVWRGVNAKVAKAMRRLGLRPGRDFIDAGFVSSTKIKAVALEKAGDGGLLMVIHLRKGSKALSIEEFTAYPDEAEILVTHGSIMRIIRYDAEAGILELELN